MGPPVDSISYYLIGINSIIYSTFILNGKLLRLLGNWAKAIGMSTYVYEVAMKVPDSLYESYLPWLKKHMSEMLNLDCFTDAELLREIEKTSGNFILKVMYFYKTSEDFQRYLDNFSERMRGDLSEETKSQIIFTRSHYERLCSE